MNSYPLPNGAKVRTTATRRYLVVSLAYGRAKVDSSCDDRHRAMARVTKNTREWGHAESAWFVIDQTTAEVWPEVVR